MHATNLNRVRAVHNDALRGYSSDGRRDIKSIAVSTSFNRPRRAGKRRFDRAFALFCVIIAICALVAPRRKRISASQPDNAPTAGLPAQPSESELEQFEMQQADRVNVTVIPRSWNRYDLPWFVPKVNYPKSLKDSNHRIIYAPTKRSMSDGLGHSMTAINYELLVALRFGLAYSHRRSTYSSLTAVAPDAVEDFFGWGDGYLPRETVREECEPTGGEWTTDDHKCVACARLRTGGGELHMQRLVQIPYRLAHKCASYHNGREHCDVAIARFLEQHNDSHTVFQLPTEVCHHPTSDSDMNDSKGLFFAHYWRRHARRGGVFARIPSPPPSARTLRLQEARVNVAVHVRRGDFLRNDVRVKRGIMLDETYAAVIADVVAIISRVDSVFQDMPVSIHIYSEGGIEEKQPYSSHATDIQNKQYFDASGTPRDVAWWKALLRSTLPRSEIGGSVERIKTAEVEMHISDDTLTSLHEMIAADVFIGSRSGLSTQLVWSLSRGIVVVPMSSSNALELGKIGQVCCSVPFDHDSGIFDASRFRRYWEAYSVANGPSAERAFNGVRRRRRRR